MYGCLSVDNQNLTVAEIKGVIECHLGKVVGQVVSIFRTVKITLHHVNKLNEIIFFIDILYNFSCIS